MNAELAGRLHDVDPAVLGERIRNLRLARGLTQTALADGAVTVGYVSRIEAGQRRPDAALLEWFARVLDITPEQLVTGIDPARADEITLALLGAQMALETGSAAEALATLESVTGEVGADLPEDLRRKAGVLQARALEALGRYDEAIIALERLLETGASEDPELPLLIALSRCLRESGDLNRAIDVGEQGVAALKAAGIDGGDEAIRLVVTVAAAYFERGDVGHAVRLAMDAISRSEEMGSTIARAAAYWEASLFESERGGAAAAIPYAQRALALLSESEDRRNLARLRAQVGRMLLQLDPPDAAHAIEHLENARAEIDRSDAGVVDLAHCDVALARAQLYAGDPQAAARIAQAVLDVTREIAPALAAEAAALLGMVASRTGDGPQAGDHYRHAVALLTALGQDRQAAQLWLELGAELDALGDAEAARDAYRRAAVSSGLRLPTGITVNR